MIGILFSLPMMGGALLAPNTPQEAQPDVAQDPALDSAVTPAVVPATASEREQQLLRRIHELEDELRATQARGLRQQEEWIEYTRLLQGFTDRLPEPPAFIAEALVPAPDPLAEYRQREAQAIALREKEIRQSLRTLLMAEGVRNIDFLEVGRLQFADESSNGRAGTGPVVARLLDDRGRMVGMVKADSMRLEPSRSGRTVTIVLEDGYESRQGVKLPFENGERRLFLGSVNPEPWIEALPELMDDASLAPVIDDGLWDVAIIRSRIARLLTASSAAGGAAWRLVGLGGIREGKLRDVQFAEIDSVTGQVTRRLFADTGRIRARQGGGIEIGLTDGTVRRGDRAAPFLNGRFSLILPYAEVTKWRAAELPGLAARGVPAPKAEAPETEIPK